MSYAVYFERGGSYRIPVNPESIERTRKVSASTYRILDGGQVLVPEGVDLEEISFEAEFPHDERSYTNPDFHDADFWEKKFRRWQRGKTSVRFIASNGIGDDINLKVLITDVSIKENAGEEGDKYITLKLQEYVKATVRQGAVVVAEQTQAVEILDTTPEPEPSTEEESKSYTVQSGDTLWGIAKKFYGNGADYQKIAEANSVKNPNLIYPGQNFTIP